MTRRTTLLGPILILPSFVIIFMILVFPVFYSLYFSVYEASFFTRTSFVGIKNYLDLLSSRVVVDSIARALAISVGSAALTIIAGFALALLCNRVGKGASYLVQVLGMIPWITSLVVAALLWKWIFAGDLGLYNYLRSLMGLEAAQPLQRNLSANLSLGFVLSWRTIGYAMVMILAGLKTVPIELAEASMVDGANALQQVFRITIPIIRTPILITAIVVTMSNINNVTIPLVLTGGGPVNATNTVSLELYRLGFLYNNYAQASALALLAFALNVALIYTYMRLIRWSV